MVKEHGPQITERSILGNTKMERKMVKEHTLGMMEESMLGNTRMV